MYKILKSTSVAIFLTATSLIFDKGLQIMPKKSNNPVQTLKNGLPLCSGQVANFEE